MILSKVVFPDPEGPIKPVNSPSFKINSTDFNAVKKSPPIGNLFITFLIFMTDFTYITSLMIINKHYLKI